MGGICEDPDIHFTRSFKVIPLTPIMKREALILKKNYNVVIYKLVKHGNGELHLPHYNVSNINFRVSPMQ